MDELNQCALDPGDLCCLEYSYTLNMNPCQHPVMDKNIHHLFVLVRSLSNTCGGVINFTLEDPETTITRAMVTTFEGRLTELIASKTELSKKNFFFIHLPLYLGTKQPWSAIYLNKSRRKLKYAPLDSRSGSKQTEFYIDMCGLIRITEPPDHQRHLQQSSSINASGLDTKGSVDDLVHPNESGENSLAAEVTTPTLEGDSVVSQPTSGDGSKSDLVDFSSINMLEWSKNKADWEKYVHGETPTLEKIVNSCLLWKPSSPIRVTPDKATLREWFPCVDDMEETLSEVDTNEPAFAVACKTWTFHISNCETESRPPGHICDILTVTNKGKVCLWAICMDQNGQNVNCQMEYLLTTGRMIKYKLLHQAEDGELSNICIDCRLFFPNTATETSDAIRLVAGKSSEMQNQILRFCDNEVNFELLQRALALIILSKTSPLRKPVGDETVITLSTQQLEVLCNKKRVNYVSGAAGSGKSYTATLLYNMYGRDNTVYISTTMEFAKYLEFSGYKGTLIQTDKDLLRKIRNGTFKNKTCIIVDDSHNFACTKLSMKSIFVMMKKHKEISLYVFADNEYQSFDKKRQQAMRDCIRELSLKVLDTEPRYSYLTTVYRNTRKMMSFVQSVIQESYKDQEKIKCGNMETGDGIECIGMQNIWDKSAENSLVVYLHKVRMFKTYKLSEIAVLLHPSYTVGQIQECGSILKEHLPDSNVHSAGVFPRQGVVVDTVSSFLGLDAPLCIYILPQRKSRPNSSFLQRLAKRKDSDPYVSMHNPNFKIFMASRATHKAVFVVPRIDAELVNELHFDYFEVRVS